MTTDTEIRCLLRWYNPGGKRRRYDQLTYITRPTAEAHALVAKGERASAKRGSGHYIEWTCGLESPANATFVRAFHETQGC